MPNFLARSMTRLSYMLRTMTSSEGPASRLTASTTPWQITHPALNTSTLRLLSMSHSRSRLRSNRRLCCLKFHGVDVRHATSSAFKDIKVRQVPKSRRRSSERHKLSAAWAMRQLWRVFTRVIVAHDRKRSLNRYVNAVTD